MRKEVLLATIFGIILGGIVLFGINLANKSVSSTLPEKKLETATTPTPTSTAKSLTIVSPQNHSVSTEKTITLSGRSTPGSNIAIVSESDDLIIESSPEGSFSAEINMISGENTITVTELKKDKSMESESITVIQSANLPE